jgi:hypothetical protein
MAVAPDDFTSWIERADIPRSRLTPELEAVLQAVFRFRQQQGTDYYSTRLLSHFLLHADTKLKVAQIARLLGISRPNASLHKKLSSKQAIQQAHHRMDGRPAGKLLPRYAGAIAAFLLGQPQASRADLLAFIDRTFSVRVSRIALYKFLKKYGLNEVAASAQPPASASSAADTSPAPSQESSSAPPSAQRLTLPQESSSAKAPARPVESNPVVARFAAPLAVPAGVIELARGIDPGQAAAPPFSSGGRTTPAPSC